MTKINGTSHRNMVFTTTEWIEYAVSTLGLEGSPKTALVRPPVIPNTFVYFIQSGEGGPIKIGYSKDPYTRFVGIQTGSPVEHTYLGNIVGGLDEEHELHARFDQHRIRGEWFKPAAEILEYIDEHRLRPETKWRPKMYQTTLF